MNVPSIHYKLHMWVLNTIKKSNGNTNYVDTYLSIELQVFTNILLTFLNRPQNVGLEILGDLVLTKICILLRLSVE